MNCSSCGSEIDKGSPTRRNMHKSCYQRLWRRGLLPPYEPRVRTRDRVEQAMAEYARLASENPHMTRRELADKMGVTVGTVDSWYRRRGVPMPAPKMRRLDYPEIVERYHDLRASGFTGNTTEAAVRLGISDRTLYRAFKSAQSNEEYVW